MSRPPNQTKATPGGWSQYAIVLLAIAMTASVSSAAGSMFPTGKEVDEMASRSAAVCVVRVVDSALRPTRGGEEMVSTCDVLETWKEPVATPLPTRLVIHRESIMGMAQLLRGQVYVLFLERLSGTGGDLAHFRRGAVWLPGLHEDPEGKQRTVRTRLVAQYRFGLEHDDDPRAVVVCLDQLGVFHELPDRPRLVELSEHVSPEIARCALLWLVQSKDRASVERAVGILLRGRERDRWDPASKPILRSAIDSAASCVEVAEANALAVAKDPEDRLLGLRLLVTVGDETSVAALVRGLDEPDPVAQYAAVRALARLTGTEESMGTFEAFERDPEAVLSKWRRWAKER